MPSENIQHYFLIISEHNIAEYRACLEFQPEHVHLIVTERVAQAATRFQSTLQNYHKEFQGKVHQIGQNLIGERAQEIQNWIKNHFLPYLQQHHITTHNAILNITGGTKILSTLLLQAHTWKELHYQPYIRDEEYPIIDRLQQKNGLDFIAETKAATTIEVLEAANLYVQVEASPHASSPTELQLQLAKQRFEEQNHIANHGFATFIQAIQAWLNAPKKATSQLIEWSALTIDKTEQDQISQLIQQLAKLLPSNQSNLIHTDQEGLHLPEYNDRNKALKAWRKWIKGDWFEQLVQHWLQQAHPTSQLVAGATICIGKGNETDILLLHHNSLHVMELKSDSTPNSGLTDYRRQLEDASNGLGKITRYLVLSPKIYRENQKGNRWQDFIKDCHAKNVHVIIADSAESFRHLPPKYTHS